MDVLTRRDLQALLKRTRWPAVSLLLPTHRGGSEQDRIGLKNLTTRAEEALAARGVKGAPCQDLLGPARYLRDDPSFWKTVCDGLALFLAPGVSAWYRVPLRLAEAVVVADRFHVKPLLPLLNDDGRYFVLALSQNQVRLLQGTRDGLRAIDLAGVPTSLAVAMRFHDRDEPLLFHSRPTSGGSWGAIFHGQGVGIDDAKDDLLRYFQQIDRGLHQLLQGEHAPLVLASVEYLWPIYRKASTYPHLAEKGVAGNPDRLSAAELHALSWPIVQPQFAEKRRQEAAAYARLAGTGRTTNDLGEVVRAAHEGRLEVLFLASDRECWGAFDAVQGTMALHDVARAGDEDLLNAAAVAMVRGGGRAYAIPAADVPGGGPAAGIYWLPAR
jgi:hypothetical protein